MKVSSRAKLIAALLALLGETFHVRESEDFDGREGAIWVAGESFSQKLQDTPAYFGYTLNKVFQETVERHGWYVDFYDSGTLMLYKA